jgi:GR25 family glycosyltransferase involved in LPS biosynthesis
MSEFEINLREIVARNWPSEGLRKRFSGTYNQALNIIAQDRCAQVPGMWRAIYRYEALLESPESAFARILSNIDVIPPRELFMIRHEYFSQTDQPDEIEALCRQAIANGTFKVLAYQHLILLKCRSGQLQDAEILVQQSVSENLPELMGPAIRYSHMLGMWPLFSELVETQGKDRPMYPRWHAVADWVRNSNSERAFPYPHRFINLERATGRRATLEERYARYGVPLDFFQAVDGTQMDEDTYRHWCPKGFLHPGGVANLRSQFAVWSEFLASDKDHILIFEDDAWPYADLATWEDLTQLVETENPDLVFLNERGAGHWWDRSTCKPWVPYAESISGWDDTMRAPGLDGYLLSRRGAEMLIENFRTDKILYNIDWQVAAYGLTDAETATMPDGIQKTVIQRCHQRGISTARLKSFALNRPIVCQFAAGHATVHETNRLVELQKK